MLEGWFRSLFRNALTNDRTSPNSVLLDSPTIRYLVAVVGNLEPVETSNSVNSPTRGLLSFRSKSPPFVNPAAKSSRTARLLSSISLQFFFFFLFLIYDERERH